ncbi:hypothetical protein AC790_21260 [Pantoea sp. RIT-PI-b]|nr:hypothetical protein AC790_21260 [Pantoea sp. RIT-PI-b]
MLGFIYLVMFLYAILSGCIITLIYWFFYEKSYFNVVMMWFLSVVFSFFIFSSLEYYGVSIIR